MKSNCIRLILALLLKTLVVSAQTSPGLQKLEIGLNFLNDYKLDSAEAIFKQLINPEIQKSQPAVYIKAELNVGRIYGDKGDNVVALQHYQEALKTAESISDEASLPYIFKNIGVLYVSWKKFDKAFDYYDKAERIAVKLNNDELVADCSNNKGIIYEQQERYPEALAAYKKALTIYTQKNISKKISMALSNIAIVYKYQKNYSEAINYNLKAISISEEMNDKWSMAATYNNIGNLYGEMGDYKKAILFCEKALNIAKEIDAGEIIESTYDSMAEAAAAAGDYKNAFAYHKLFSEALNKFINTENTKQLSELNIKYESGIKQSLIDRQQFEIEQKNNWLLFGAILFLVSLLAVYFIYKNYRSKQSKRLQQEIYRQQELAAKSLFDGEQNERIRIARDLHDGVGQMLSLLKINLSNMDTSEPPIQKAIVLADKTIDEVRNVSHNLIPEELNFGIFRALENLSEKINTSGSTKIDVDIPGQLRSLPFERQNELSIYRIVQEVVNNMVKHAEASLINLSIRSVGDQILITVKDNGRGLHLEDIEKSKGIGWKNINARVHMLEGKINIQSEKLSGTQIEITLPVNGTK